MWRWKWGSATVGLILIAIQFVLPQRPVAKLLPA